MANFCSNCGTALTDTNIACTVCGQAIQRAADTSSQSATFEINQKIESFKSKWLTKGNLTLAAICLAVAGLLWVIYEYLMGYILVGGVLYAAYYFIGKQSECSACGKIYAMRAIRKDYLDSEDAVEDIVRRDQHQNQKGEVTGYTERVERVSGTRTYHRVHYECKHCKNEFNQVESSFS